MYSGVEGRPRYCPSIETRFTASPTRTAAIGFFIEPEGLNAHGLAKRHLSTLRFDVQYGLVRSIRSGERYIVQPVYYMLEYDTSLRGLNESGNRVIAGLLLPGQINNFPGAEETGDTRPAGWLQRRRRASKCEDSWCPSRDRYQLLLVDDRCGRTQRPYRMFTSRASATICVNDADLRP
jgi:tRNA U34 5-carboxymethylaminomethyl modifying enzyme MnmG/GidA